MTPPLFTSWQVTSLQSYLDIGFWCLSFPLIRDWKDICVGGYVFLCIFSDTGTLAGSQFDHKVNNETYYWSCRILTLETSPRFCATDKKLASFVSLPLLVVGKEEIVGILCDHLKEAGPLDIQPALELVAAKDGTNRLCIKLLLLAFEIIVDDGSLSPQDERVKKDKLE